MTRAIGLLLLLLSPISRPELALAQGGVIEISQVIALAGGVNGDLVADPPGFPVRITQPGSYRLSSNLDVRVAATPENVDAIEVAVNDVSVDLHGFGILGPTVCTGAPPGTDLVCAPLGGGHGIDANLRTNVSIFGGRITGTGSRGVLCGFACLIERLHVENSGATGIVAADGSLISGNTARRNRFEGIAFTSTGGLTIRGNTVLENGGNGIHAGGGDTIEGNTSRENRGAGIFANQGCTVVGNTVRLNGGAGIQASDSLVIDNTVTANTGLGLDGGPFVAYGRNLIRSNAGGTVDAGIQIAPNLCETDTICP
jgi:parallel beta-helix repeat protein